MTTTAEAFGDELVIFCARTEQMHCLDRSASIIWALCDGSRTVERVVDELAKTLELDADTLRVDVEKTVAKFAQLGILR